MPARLRPRPPLRTNGPRVRRAAATRHAAHPEETSPTMTTQETIDELRDWASSRIEHCRREEAKFAEAWVIRPLHPTGPPQALVEAWTERRALEAVLRILRGEP